MRAKVARKIEALTKRSGIWIGVSSRLTGYVGDARLDGDFLELQIQPFDPPAADDFIGRWFDAVDPAHASERADGLRRHLADACTKHIRLNELRANPLQLTILCLVWRDRGEALSTERADLYAECLQVLLDRWRLAGIVVRWSAAQALAVLQPLARHLHEQHAARLSRADLVPVVADALAAAGMSATPAEFLAELGEESGVFVAHGNDEFGFLHLGFQEYLTARDLQGRAVRAALAGQELAPLAQLVERLLARGSRTHTDQRWWHEVAELLVALDGAPMFAPLVRSALDAPGWLVLEPTMRDWIRMAREREATALSVAARDKRRSPEERATAAELATALGAPSIAADVGHTASTQPPATQNRAGLELVAIQRGDETFWLARTCVTNAQYRRFTEATGHAPPPSWRDSRFNGDEQPVVEVSWHDAQAFCKWAGLRLPTEEEWEYACRAGTTTEYWSGDDESDLDRVGWYSKNSNGRTQPVGLKPPNPFGLFDMHGNVWEWCENEWAPGSGYRVLRGGSWFGVAGDCRSACRYFVAPDFRLDFVGFRPASSSPVPFTTSQGAGPTKISAPHS